jgi:hypothetical protein
LIVDGRLKRIGGGLMVARFGCAPGGALCHGRALAEGIKPDCDIHREIITERRVKLSLDPDFHILGEFKAQDTLLRVLLRRRWLLLEAPDDSGGFITTDVAVCLWPSDGPRPARPIRFDDPQTMVLFPISPRLLASGKFDGREGNHQDRPAHGCQGKSDNVYTGEAGARRVQKFRVVERQRCK